MGCDVHSFLYSFGGVFLYGGPDGVEKAFMRVFNISNVIERLDVIGEIDGYDRQAGREVFIYLKGVDALRKFSLEKG